MMDKVKQVKSVSGNFSHALLSFMYTRQFGDVGLGLALQDLIHSDVV
jgi:glycine cleavage system protein P-like pyridoxal-binding family